MSSTVKTPESRSPVNSVLSDTKKRQLNFGTSWRLNRPPLENQGPFCRVPVPPIQRRLYLPLLNTKFNALQNWNLAHMVCGVKGR
jgi:hypothetical protein